MDEENHSTVAGNELNNRTEVNVGEWFAAEPFSRFFGVALVVWDSYTRHPLSRSQF